MAILGMLRNLPSCASLVFLGRRSKVTGLVSTIGLSAHWLVTFDAGMVTWRRHLPSCMTSEKSVPQGTLLRTKCPAASVNAAAIGEPVTWPSQEAQVTPVGMGSRSLLGMDTITLYSGL
jgi:hypothetical protein